MKKQCLRCGAYSANDVLFCKVCGSSFGVKLCPQLHSNPTTSRYCRVCGSKSLSRPHQSRPPTISRKILVAILMFAVAAFAFVVLQLVPRDF